MGKIDDNTLVKQVIQGRIESYQKIVERYQARIFYLGLKFFRNFEDAEDFAQEVFLRAYEKLSSFRGMVTFAAWFYRLAFNLAVNRYRLNRRRLLEVTLDERLPDAGPSPEDKLLDRESLEMVEEVLKKIPDTYNIILKMHYFDGLSYPEISLATDIPVNTIKSHVFRAKKLIKKKLARLFYEGVKR